MRLICTVFIFVITHVLVAQRQDKVDFKQAKVLIELQPKTKSIIGKVDYSFTILKDVDSVFLDAKRMDITSVDLNGQSFGYGYNNEQVVITNAFKSGEEHRVSIRYSCIPKQTVYFLGFDDTTEGNEQIWTQGQGKYTSHWLPSFDDMNEKVEFDLSFINIPNGLTVVANGKLVPKSESHDGNVTTVFDMKSPMSSYLVAFAMGNFESKTVRSNSGVPMHLYYEPQDSSNFEPTYRYSKEIFDFLEDEIGVPYPWQNYKQVPVHDFLYAGMENTGTTLFSNGYVIDSIAFVDKNYVNVNAHELTHQWFGNLVTEESGQHHWLHEGFATFYAYLAEQKLFGDDHMYWKLYDMANTLNNLSENGGGEALTDPNANSLTFYEKGALALFILRDTVGEAAFKKGIRNFLEKYQYSNVTIGKFLEEVADASAKDLSHFKNEWLEGDEFPWEDVIDFFHRNNPSVSRFISANKIQGGSQGWKTKNNPWQYTTHMMDRDKSKLTLQDYRTFLGHEEIKVRQKALQLLDSVPLELKNNVSALLEEKSHITVENALYKLWVSYPTIANKYLDQTENSIGLPNKNVHLLWLALALITPEYKVEKKKEWYNKLNGYTENTYHFEIRQQAFQYLSQLQAMNQKSYVNLISAADHHVWQFKKSSRKLLRELYRSKKGKMDLDKLKPSLPTKQKDVLMKVLAK